NNNNNNNNNNSNSNENNNPMNLSFFSNQPNTIKDATVIATNTNTNITCETKDPFASEMYKINESKLKQICYRMCEELLKEYFRNTYQSHWNRYLQLLHHISHGEIMNNHHFHSNKPKNKYTHLIQV
ncbi:helicase superfamily 1 and 2 domain-containing protein, partial [Reticulomyxa filosa]